MGNRWIVIVWGVSLLYACLSARVGAAETAHLSVDFNTVIQPNYLGVNAVYHGFAFMPESERKGYTAAFREREFDRVSTMSLHVARTWYRPDYAWVNGKWDWNSPKMTAFYSWLKEMKARKVEIALQAAWWCPRDVLYDAPLAVPGDWNASVKRYAEWVSESVHQIVQVKGFTNVKYLLVFTEPNYNSGNPPNGMTGWECWLDCAKALHQRLVTDKRRNLVKLVGPDEGSTDKSAMLKWTAERANDIIDIYSSHNYHAISQSDLYTQWYNNARTGMEACASTGKPYWFDEYGLTDEKFRRESPEYGVQLALAQAAFMNAGAQTSLIWLLFDQQYVDPLEDASHGDSFYHGVHKWGTTPWQPERVTPYPSYYAFALMSRYLGGPGTQVLKTVDAAGVRIAATRQKNGAVTFLVVNDGAEPRDIAVTCGKAIGKPLYRYLYESASIKPDESGALIGYDKVISNVKSEFTDTIPAKSVVVFSTKRGFPISTH